MVINVQRAGPSTGMPTKTEQSDLLEVLYGRNGESPCVVLAISSPADAFETTLEACRIAIEHMLPGVFDERWLDRNRLGTVGDSGILNRCPLSHQLFVSGYSEF